MTVKEPKRMLENADDNAIVVVRNNWAPAEFLNTSARKMVLVKANGKLRQICPRNGSKSSRLAS